MPWARRYTAAVATRHQLDLDDAWAETLTALLGAAVYFRPGAGTFSHYASRAVIRALWRYGARTTHRRPTVPLDLVRPTDLPHVPSAERVAAALLDLDPRAVAHQLETDRVAMATARARRRCAR